MVPQLQSAQDSPGCLLGMQSPNINPRDYLIHPHFTDVESGAREAKRAQAGQQSWD